MIWESLEHFCRFQWKCGWTSLRCVRWQTWSLPGEADRTHGVCYGLHFLVAVPQNICINVPHLFCWARKCSPKLDESLWQPHWNFMHISQGNMDASCLKIIIKYKLGLLNTPWALRWCGVGKSTSEWPLPQRGAPGAWALWGTWTFTRWCKC